MTQFVKIGNTLYNSHYIKSLTYNDNDCEIVIINTERLDTGKPRQIGYKYEFYTVDFDSLDIVQLYKCGSKEYDDVVRFIKSFEIPSPSAL